MTTKVWRSLDLTCRKCADLHPLVLDEDAELICSHCDMAAYCVDCGTKNGRLLSQGWFVPEGFLCPECARRRSKEPDWYTGPMYSLPPSMPPEPVLVAEEPVKTEPETWWQRLVAWLQMKT